MDKNKKGWVDLYYNDVICLRKIFLTTVIEDKKHPIKKYINPCENF